MVVTRPERASRWTKKPPPPIPHEYGSVTPSAAAVAMAASTALPPSASTRRPMSLAYGSTDDTAPPEPIASGTFSGSGTGSAAWAVNGLPAAAVTPRAAPAANTVRRLVRGTGGGCIADQLLRGGTTDHHHHCSGGTGCQGPGVTRPSAATSRVGVEAARPRG